MAYLSMTERAKMIREELKLAGYSRSKVSVKKTRGSAFRITVKDPNADLELIKTIAVQGYEEIDRDRATGETLSGGNTFVFVDYSEEAQAIIGDNVYADCITPELVQDLEENQGRSVGPFHVYLDRFKRLSIYCGNTRILDCQSFYPDADGNMSLGPHARFRIGYEHRLYMERMEQEDKQAA